MKHNPHLCRRVLAPPHISAQPIADSPPSEGCGWTNGVRMSSAGGVHAGFDKVTCEAAAALALWLEHDVQPVAQEMFGQRVASIQSFGTYSCRNIIGNAKFWKSWRSEHATANAVDIGAFSSPTDAASASCSIGRATASRPASCALCTVAPAATSAWCSAPTTTTAHHDHFHLDRGILSRCK